MSFKSSTRFFMNRVESRQKQLGYGQHSVAVLENRLKYMAFLNFEMQEKAFYRPFYHALNAVRDIAALIGGIAVTLGSLYYDRTLTLGLGVLCLMQFVNVLADCLFALASLCTFISRSVQSMRYGYDGSRYDELSSSPIAMPEFDLDTATTQYQMTR